MWSLSVGSLYSLIYLIQNVVLIISIIALPESVNLFLDHSYIEFLVIKLNSINPNGVEMAVLGMSSGATGI